MNVRIENRMLERNGSAAASERGEALRIAVASCGLGHVRRGIETWAEDLAAALRRAGLPVTLFQGAGESREPWRQVVGCRRRFEPGVERLVKRLRPFGGWRLGLGNGYGVEQLTFALRLWPRIHAGYDILHVQDPLVAAIFDRLRRLGLSSPRPILAHGTEEPPDYLRRFRYLQHLAPCYLEEWRAHRPPKQAAFAVPNFIDVETFRPGDSREARAAFGLPQDRLIVLCVAALKKHHKRIDYLLEEFAAFGKAYDRPAMLVIAGARERETPEVMEMGRALLGERVLFLEGLPRQRIPALYRAADVFAIASKHEMMPIAVLEALASGLPVACNDTPVLRWMVGPGGRPADITAPGGLAEQLARLANPEARVRYSAAARSHAIATFSEQVVIRQILEMYAEVMLKDRLFST